MTLFTCQICERECDTDKHGAHDYKGGFICDDCKYGHDDEDEESDA